MTDHEIVNKIVDIQVKLIQQQRRFRDQPLENPGLLPDQKKTLDELWQEAIKRELNEKINEEVRKLSDDAT